MSTPTARCLGGGAAIAALTIGLVVAVSAPASAHDGLVSSSPAADSTVTAPLESVSLTFSNELLDIGDANGAFVIQVVGPDELFYNLDCVKRDGATASTAVALGESGSYVVTWQVVSSDAHPTSDSFDFVYNKPTDETAAAGSATAPCRTDGSPVAQGGGEDSSQANAEARTVMGIWVGGGTLVAFLVLCAIVVAVMGARSRRRQQRSSGHPQSSDQQSPAQEPSGPPSPDERQPE